MVLSLRQSGRESAFAGIAQVSEHTLITEDDAVILDDYASDGFACQGSHWHLSLRLKVDLDS